MTHQRDRTIYVGSKPPIQYVLAVVTEFSSGTGPVTIKARGRAISTACDVAEIVRSRHVKDANYKDVRISTETVQGDGGRHSKVTSIHIVLEKPGGAAAEPPA
jgi:DNA-binding protein